MTEPVLAKVCVDMSKGWVSDHPELAGKSLYRFFSEHPPEEWTLTITRANHPGMWLTLRAVAKEKCEPCLSGCYP